MPLSVGTSPAPIPSSTRPFETWSTVSTCPANSVGCRGTSRATKVPSRKVLVVSLIFLCLTAAALVSYGFLYHQSAKELNDSLYRITQNEIESKK